MLTLCDTPIRAVSVAGLETCIELPSWKLAFDIGRCPPGAERMPRVLFSHAHVDHMGGVVHHCATRALMGMPPPEYALPRQNVEAFHQLLDAWRTLDRSDLPCTVTGVQPGDRLPLAKGRYARVFQALHRVPCVGYALCRANRKLRPDLRDVPRADLLAAREAGVELEVEEEVVEVAFCGDTLVDVVDRESCVRTARLLILEVSFFDERVPVDRTRAKGHVHLDEVIARADRFENERILITHASARYGAAEIERILARKLPASLRERVVPLLPEARPPR